MQFIYKLGIYFSYRSLPHCSNYSSYNGAKNKWRFLFHGIKYIQIYRQNYLSSSKELIESMSNTIINFDNGS
jgi:hypothetical protein